VNEREFRSLFPNASASLLEANGFPCRKRDQPERTHALEQTPQRTKASLPRVTVRFTVFRCRPLDPDNNARSVKDLLDGLRHAHLIHGDETWRIILTIDQIKVAHQREERTEIEIFYP
jgi:hypothetical protein